VKKPNYLYIWGRGTAAKPAPVWTAARTFQPTKKSDASFHTRAFTFASNKNCGAYRRESFGAVCRI
jgi:hypothetical protein